MSRPTFTGDVIFDLSNASLVLRWLIQAKGHEGTLTWLQSTKVCSNSSSFSRGISFDQQIKWSSLNKVGSSGRFPKHTNHESGPVDIACIPLAFHLHSTLEDNSFWSLRRMGDWRIWFFHFCRRQANFHTFKTLHQCQECLLTDTKCQKTLQNHKIKTLHILSSTSSHQSCRRGSS